MPPNNYLVTIGLASLVMLVLLLPFEVQGQSEESPGKYGHPNPGTITEYLQRDAGDVGKFDDGFYEHVLALQVEAAQGQAGWQRSADSNYHTVVIAVTKYDENGRDVSAENKNAVVDILEQAGARNIAVSETLSFITASVPVGNILELSWHGEVHRLGNGEALSLPAIDTMRATIGAMPDDLRRLDGTIVNGSGVKVGVIDSGINHPQGINDKVIGRAACDGYSCRSTSAQSVIGSDPGNQWTSHGTNVALIIAGHGFSQNNGIAPGVGILNAIVQLWDVPIMHGISWTLGQGADVTNISLHANRCNGIDFGTTRQLVAGEAVESGMVLAVAAGNQGSRGIGGDRTPVYKSINEWGCSHNVITVGGINDRDPDNVVMFAASSRGPGSHLVNGTIYPILKPEIVAPARSVETAGYVACPSGCLPSGTSYAAPAVTAAAALVLDERHLEPAGVKAALLLGANWTGPVPCTSVQYEQKNATDDCSHERQPAGFAEANHDGSLGIINNVGFGILDAGAAVDYATRASGSHVVEGSLDSDDEVDEYRFRVTNTEEPVKVILTWTSDPYYDGPWGYKGENYFADLGFTVACPGMDVVSAQSDYQANEFAVFMPAQTGVCTVAVAGSGIDTPRRSQQDYSLAGTTPFDVDELLRPFPVLSPSEKSPTNAVNITFTVDFGAQMNADTFDSSDILASGGLVSTPAPVNGTSRAFTFEISDIPEGSLTVYMPEGAVLDQDGNSNSASDTRVIEIDRTRPTSIISTAVSSPVNASSVTFTVDFGEPVDQATFTILDISVSGGTVSDPLPVDGTGMEFTLEVSDLAAGNLTVSIPEGGVLDPAGNNNTASNTYVVEITRPRPAPVISTTEPSRSNAHSIAFTVDFGVPVDQATFTASDISVSGGTVSDPLPADGTGMKFTFEVSGPADGSLTVSIPEGGVLDPVGNSNTASDTRVIEIERTRPTPIISTAVSSPVNASSVTFTVDFGEPVDRTTFTILDIFVSGGTMSDPLPVDGTGMEFTFEVSGLAAGSLAVSIPEGGVLDPAGNNNTASNQMVLTVTRIPAGTTPDAAFVTTWKTTSANESIWIPVGEATGTYTVTWGDANIDVDVSGNQGHTYKAAGTYTVSIYGDFPQIYLPYHPESPPKLQSIEQWGDIRWKSMKGAFSGAINMVYRATDTPDLSGITDTSGMFMHAFIFNGSLSNWDVSSVTDMSRMFAIARPFNGDISGWNVSAATDMSEMLAGADGFTRNLGDWYIVLDDTTMSDANETLAISAQNAYLNGQNLAYVVDDANFAVVDGALAIKPGRSVQPGTYNVNVTVGGVIGEAFNTFHSRTVQITVEGDTAPPTILSAVYLAGNGTLTVTFSEPLDGTIHHDRIHIRDAGQSNGGISLDEAQIRHSSDPVVTIMLTTQQQADFARMATPQLDVDQGAVSDVAGNEIGVGNARTVEITTDAVQANNPPTINAGDSQEVVEGATVTLNGTSSDSDPEDSPMYSWSHNSTLPISLDDSVLAPSFTAPNVPENTVIEFTLTVSDGTASVSDKVIITITDSANAAPTVNAGPDQEIDEGSTVTLNGNATDADDDSLTYSWHQTSGLPAVDLLGANTPSPTFTAPAVASDTVFIFEMTVYDGSERSTDAVEVIIRDMPDLSYFITTWRTGAAGESITIPVGDATGTYTVDWGDGNTSVNVTGDQTHVYGDAGTYTVRISGDFTRIYLNDHPSNADKLASIEQWGDIRWESMISAFHGAANMVYRATDTPVLSDVTSMRYMFYGAPSFDGNLSGWDVSRVTDMAGTFWGASSFDGNLSGWDVSRVTDMPNMFRGASSFDADLSGWNVSNVVAMSTMFMDASSFDADLSGWDVSSVTDMSNMLRGASSFDGNLSGWDVSRVTDMSDMFSGAHSFNADLSGWDVSRVTDMYAMFHGAHFFNADLSGWDVSRVTDMAGTFWGASSFDGNLSGWDVSRVTDMAGTFWGASSFDGDLSGWNVSSVTDMASMFAGASSFDGDLSGWDVSNVTDMSNMLRGASSFDGDLSGWNVSSVTDMASMFASASSFDGNLSGWDVSRVTDMPNMFRGASSFDADLSGWNVSNVVAMSTMFMDASSFDADLSGWDVSNVTDMSNMLRGASSFDGNLSGWNVSRVTDMSDMFSGAHSFNADLSGWDVSRVTDMYAMFHGAHSFNADLSGWDVSRVTDMHTMFHQTNAFDQNLGRWYIVLDDTVIEGDNATGTVGRITAQNSFLGAQSPAYGIGSGVDSASFEMDGASLRLKAISDRLTKDLYTVNVTSSGGFGTNNFRILEVSVGVSGIPPAAGTDVNQTAFAEPAVPPGAPQSLRAASTDTTVTLTWDHPGDDSITGYKILSRTPATQSQLSVLVDDTGAPGTSYVIEDLDPDTVYVFRVIAVNAHGESDNSNFVRLSTDAVSAPANAPDAPQSLRAASTDTTVTLTWDHPGDDSITGYKILSRTPATQSQLSVLVDDTGAPGTSYVIEGLDPDTVYVFRVIAVNAHGESDNSNFVRLSTLS